MSGRIPDSIVMANVRGTYEVPQLYCAAAICVGATATPLLLNEQTTWSDLQFGMVTDDQADRVGRAVNAAHAKYDIPARFSADRPEGTTDEERAAGAPILISRQSLKTVTANGIYNMTVAATMFAMRTSGLELGSFIPAKEAERESTFHELSNPILHEFFTNPLYLPRVLALEGLWKESASLLRERNFLKQAGDYRHGVSEKHGTSAYRQHRLQMEGRMFRALRTRLGPIAVRRAIEQESGYLVPSTAVEVFAKNVSDSLSHMPSPQRIDH